MLDDEQFIEEEYKWPSWPFLFIKKRQEKGTPDTGFIYGSLERKKGEPFKCYLNCNLYIPNTWEGKEPALMTAKEIVEAGWIVD